MTRQTSNQALVAKRIRQDAKRIGIKCRATSDSFSMGNSVTVTVYNQPPAIMKALNELWGKYQYGHFDGMQDMYEYSNSRDDIPQTKYLHINNKLTDTLKQTAWDFLRNNICEMDGSPVSFSDAQSFRIHDAWGDQVLWRFLGGVEYTGLMDLFWEQWNNEPA